MNVYWGYGNSGKLHIEIYAKYNGMTPRDVLLTVYGPLVAQGNQAEADIVAREILTYLDDDMELAQTVPMKYRKEFYELLESEANAYGSLSNLSIK